MDDGLGQRAVRSDVAAQTPAQGRLDVARGAGRQLHARADRGNRRSRRHRLGRFPSSGIRQFSARRGSEFAGLRGGRRQIRQPAVFAQRVAGSVQSASHSTPRWLQRSGSLSHRRGRAAPRSPAPQRAEFQLYRSIAVLAALWEALRAAVQVCITSVVSHPSLRRLKRSIRLVAPAPEARLIDRGQNGFVPRKPHKAADQLGARPVARA